MQEKELVSIIVPVYNVETYVSKCIDSIVNQNYSNLEIILIDDGSKDNSSKICDEWSTKDRRIKVFHKKNGGVSSARNYGIKKSSGKYVCFVDSDDYLAPEFVTYMFFLIKKTKSSFAFSKNCFISSNQLQVSDDCIKCVDSVKGTELLLSPYIEVGCWNKIYETKLLKENELYFNEKLFFGEGLDFICRVAQTSDRIGVGEKRYYYYRKNNLESATTKFDYSKYINGEKSLLKIKDEFKKTSRKLEIAWNLHYALFCINTEILLITNKKNIVDYKSKIKKWRAELKRKSKLLVFSHDVEFKQKVKIIISLYCPCFLVIIKKYKAKKIIKLSV